MNELKYNTRQFMKIRITKSASPLSEAVAGIRVGINRDIGVRANVGADFSLGAGIGIGLVEPDLRRRFVSIPIPALSARAKDDSDAHANNAVAVANTNSVVGNAPNVANVANMNNAAIRSTGAAAEAPPPIFK